MNSNAARFVLIVLFVIVTAGCSQADGSPPKSMDLPNNAAGTVKAVTTGLVNHQPQIVVKALPESYYNEFVELIGIFAGKIDPALYDRTMAVVGRAVEVLIEKQDIILASETAAMSPADPDDLSQGMGASLAVMQTLLSSEISTVAGLQAINWEQFFATTGSEIMKQTEAIEDEDGENPLQKLKTLQVETLEETSDTAKLRLTVEGEEPEVFDMVRVEGRWIPAELAEEWPKAMADLRQKLEEMDPEKMEEIKGQALMGLAMAEGIIGQVAAIETSEEFDALVGPMIQALMGSMGSMMPEEDYSADES